MSCHFVAFSHPEQAQGNVGKEKCLHNNKKPPVEVKKKKIALQILLSNSEVVSWIIRATWAQGMDSCIYKVDVLIICHSLEPTSTAHSQNLHKVVIEKPLESQHDEGGMLTFKLGTRLWKKGNLNDLKWHNCWCQAGRSEYVRNLSTIWGTVVCNQFFCACMSRWTSISNIW